MRRLASVSIAMASLIALFSATTVARAQTAFWSDANIRDDGWPYDGNRIYTGGTVTGYTITDETQLGAFAHRVTSKSTNAIMDTDSCPSDFQGFTLKLTKDIYDLSMYEWKPIGRTSFNDGLDISTGVANYYPPPPSDMWFNGTFDGNQKTLHGIRIVCDNSGYPPGTQLHRRGIGFGFFSVVRAQTVIKDLAVTDVSVLYVNETGVPNSDVSIGALVGCVVEPGPLPTGAAVTLENCFIVSGSVHARRVQHDGLGAGYVAGGLIGGFSTRTVPDNDVWLFPPIHIRNCINAATVTVSTEEETASGQHFHYAGGIIGFVHAYRINSYASILNCLNLGAVTYVRESGVASATAAAGGICGELNGGEVRNCLNMGTVTSDNAVGSMIGQNFGGTYASFFYSLAGAAPGNAVIGNGPLPPANTCHIVTPPAPGSIIPDGLSVWEQNDDNGNFKKDNPLDALNAWVERENAKGGNFALWTTDPANVFYNGYPVLGNFLTSTPPAQTCTITYDYNGATGGTNGLSKTVTLNDPYGTLPDPARTGWQFIGWFHGLALTTPLTTVTDPADHTLGAIWFDPDTPLLTNADTLGDLSVPSATPGVTNNAPLAILIIPENGSPVTVLGHLLHNPDGTFAIGLDTPLPAGGGTLTLITLNPGDANGKLAIPADIPLAVTFGQDWQWLTTHEITPPPAAGGDVLLAWDTAQVIWNTKKFNQHGKPIRYIVHTSDTLATPVAQWTAYDTAEPADATYLQQDPDPRPSWARAKMLNSAGTTRFYKVMAVKEGWKKF